MKKSVLFEDTTMAYNRWVQGVATRQLDAMPTSLNKLLGLDGRDNQYPNKAKANKTLHPILDNTPEIIGNALVSLLNLRSKLNVALQSNLRESKRDRAKLLETRQQVQKTLNELRHTIKLFDQL